MLKEITSNLLREEDQRPLLSIIVIARNEEARIASVIESVLQEAKKYPGTEVILIDSASTDSTVKIASSYPIGVIRLPGSWFLSAAAGRYIGYLKTSGQFILHLDGDMVLKAGWLAIALPYMIANPKVAACSGYWENIYEKNGEVLSRQIERLYPGGKEKKVHELGGAALYRRSALEQAGGFNPYIYSYEEPELCARLRHAGFELVCFPQQICWHYGLPEHSLANYWRRWKNLRWMGSGQILRYHLGKNTFAQVARLQGVSYLISTAGAFLALTGLFSLGWLLQNLWFFLFATGGIAGIFIVLLYKKGSLSQALLSILLRGLILVSGFIGFLMPRRDPATYPTEAEIIQPFSRPPSSNR